MYIKRASSLEENGSPTGEDPEKLITVSDVLGFTPPEDMITDGAEFEEPAPTPTDPYSQWRNNPNPDTLFAVTKHLRPTIDSVMASMGASGNPQMAAKARVVAAKAVQTYNPESGASLPTWVSTQLRQLTRDNRKSNSVLAVPDKMYLDGFAIHKAELELEDELGYEPTMEEIADRSGIPVKRIKAVRNKMRKVRTETPVLDDSGNTPEAAVHKTDFVQEALDYVYNDSDRVDKKILEYLTGYGGKGVQDAKYTMEKLKLTPVQLTRRKAKLSARIQAISSDLEAIQ